MNKGVCLIIGAGDGGGAGIARAFAAAGHEVCLTRRSRHIEQLERLAEDIRKRGGRAHAFGVDARSEEETVELFRKIEAEIGAIEVLVFNIGANVSFAGVDTTAQVFRKVWEMACFAGFLAAREAAKVMIPRGRGTIILTGATASVRGGPLKAAFSSAKHGLRAVARSFARELGPQGIHVAHVIIDGGIMGQFMRENVPSYEQLVAREQLLNPDDIGRFYVEIHNQPRSTWVHQADLRPWSEAWEWG